MAYLTHDEVMLAHIAGPPFRLAVYHDPNWWSRINNYHLPTPVRLKFDTNIRTNMSTTIKKAKGIYMFFLEPEHPFPNEIRIRHLLYVGRVQSGKTGYNFFKRFNSYVKDIGNKKSPRNRMRLTNLWPDHTFVYYFDLCPRTDEEIRDIERSIFNNIVPPLNEELHGESRTTRQFY